MSEKFGHFSDDGWQYKITAARTPRRWFNYIGSGDYGVCIANDGTGYSANHPPEGSRVTEPNSGRFVYLKEVEKEDIWSITSAPVHTDFDDYECCHSVGYTRFKSRINEIQSEMLVFVPLNESLECWEITLKNESSNIKTLQIFPYIEWNLSGYLLPWDAYQNYSHCFYKQEENTVTCVLDDPLYPWIRHYGFMVSNERPMGWECGKSAFVRPDGDLSNPRSVSEMKCTNTSASTEVCAAAMQFEVTLKPGEVKKLNFVIAYSKNMPEESKTARKYCSPDGMAQAFDKVCQYWQSKFSAVQVQTPDTDLNRLMNIWLKHQIYQANMWCRGGSCRGFRDTLQDAVGAVSFDDELSLLQIERALKHQYADGYAPRQFAEEGGPHDVRFYSDNSAWIPYAINCYVKETGDFGVLEKKIPFLESGTHSLDMEYSMKQVTEFLDFDTKNSGTVFEHAVKAMDYMWKQRGEHGLSLIFGGDWNDPLNYAGRQGKGESVWLSMFFIFAMQQMVELCDYLGNDDMAEEYRARCSELKNLINLHAWDGQWYLRAFDDKGGKIGSSSNQYGQIYILSQSWAVISGTADARRAETALGAVKKQLDTPYGFLTMQPAYPSYDPNVGRISILRPGTFENSAIYCHASAWQMLADLIAGNADDAYRTYLKMNPNNPEHPTETSFSEPYVFPNCYFGRETGTRYGQSVMGWLTATADWIYKIVLEWMIGVRPDYDGIIIDPKLPSAWKNAAVTKKIRGCTYEITIERSGLAAEGVCLIEVDGKGITGGTIPYFNDNLRHTVKVLIS